MRWWSAGAPVVGAVGGVDAVDGDGTGVSAAESVHPTRSSAEAITIHARLARGD